MRHRLDYDFTLAATLIQAVYRGYEVRQRLKLALKRASGCFEEILQEMQTICPDYQFRDGVDVVVKTYSEGVVYLPLLTPCDVITPSDLHQPAATSQPSTSIATIASSTGDGIGTPLSMAKDFSQRREKVLLEEKAWLEDAIVRRLRVSCSDCLPALLLWKPH